MNKLIENFQTFYETNQKEIIKGCKFGACGLCLCYFPWLTICFFLSSMMYKLYFDTLIDFTFNIETRETVKENRRTTDPNLKIRHETKEEGTQTKED
jgi:hypothetical protein